MSNEDLKKKITEIGKLFAAEYHAYMLFSPMGQVLVQQELARENAIHRCLMCCEDERQQDTLRNIFEDINLSTVAIELIGDSMMAGKMPQDVIDELINSVTYGD